MLITYALCLEMSFCLQLPVFLGLEVLYFSKKTIKWTQFFCVRKKNYTGHPCFIGKYCYSWGSGTVVWESYNGARSTRLLWLCWKLYASMWKVLHGGVWTVKVSEYKKDWGKEEVGIGEGNSWAGKITSWHDPHPTHPCQGLANSHQVRWMG